MISLVACISAVAGGSLNENYFFTLLGFLKSSNIQDSPDLLERLAENPHTNPDTLARLAMHNDPRIRAAVAENPQMPEKTIRRLANDIHPDVRLRLAGSYFLPCSILQILAEDDNPYVQLRAKKTIDRLRQPLSTSLSLGCC